MMDGGRRAVVMCSVEKEFSVTPLPLLPYPSFGLPVCFLSFFTPEGGSFSFNPVSCDCEGVSLYTPPHQKWSENSALSSQRPHGPPMADQTPSIRVAPPDGTGNPIPERFSLGLAPKKPPPLAPARASGASERSRPRGRKGRLRVSIAGREGRPHPRGWLCVCLPDSDGRLRGRACVLSPSHPREMAESTEPHAASPWTQGSDFYREIPSAPAVKVKSSREIDAPGWALG